VVALGTFGVPGDLVDDVGVGDGEDQAKVGVVGGRGGGVGDGFHGAAPWGALQAGRGEQCAGRPPSIRRRD